MADDLDDSDEDFDMDELDTPNIRILTRFYDSSPIKKQKIRQTQQTTIDSYQNMEKRRERFKLDESTESANLDLAKSAEKLQQRAKRFKSNALQPVNTVNKKRARALRFNQTLPQDEAQKRNTRAQRFGKQTHISNKSNGRNSHKPHTTDRKRKRELAKSQGSELTLSMSPARPTVEFLETVLPRTSSHIGVLPERNSTNAGANDAPSFGATCTCASSKELLTLRRQVKEKDSQLKTLQMNYDVCQKNFEEWQSKCYREMGKAKHLTDQVQDSEERYKASTQQVQMLRNANEKLRTRVSELQTMRVEYEKMKDYMSKFKD